MIGPNEQSPTALTRLLQSDSPLQDVGAPTLEADVLVIGRRAGVAALTAARAGARAPLATNWVWAQQHGHGRGGIQAAVGDDDSLQEFEDTFVRAFHR